MTKANQSPVDRGLVEEALKDALVIKRVIASDRSYRLVHLLRRALEGEEEEAADVSTK